MEIVRQGEFDTAPFRLVRRFHQNPDKAIFNSVLRKCAWIFGYAPETNAGLRRKAEQEGTDKYNIATFG